MVVTTRRVQGFAAALGAAVLIAGFYLALAPWHTLWDRDEAHYAQVAVEMARSGDFLVPTFNGAPWLEKPPLTYWLMVGSQRVLGASALALRLPAALGVALSALFVFVIGRRLLSASAGAWAMATLVSTPLVMVAGGLAITDAILLASTTGALAAFVALGPGRPGGRVLRVSALAVAIACGSLTKGPAGVAVPLCAIIPAAWVQRRDDPALRDGGGCAPALAELGAALTLGLVGFAAWAVPADAATGGSVVNEFFGRQVVQRVLTPLQGHGGNLFLALPVYLAVVLAGFAPWTLFLPGALWAFGRGAVGGRRGRALLAGWTLGPFTLFTLAATKLPTYVLPIWPALALGTAATLVAADRGALPGPGLRRLRQGVWLLAPVLTLELAALAWCAVAPPLPELRLPAVCLAALVATAAGMALRAHLAGAFRRAAATLAAVTLLAQALIAIWVLPIVDTVKPVLRLAAAIRASTAATVPVATAGFFEPSLVFYLGRTPVRELAGEAAIASWARTGGDGVLVLPRPLLERALRADGALPVSEIAAATGVNVSKGRRVELVAVVRGARP